MGGEVQDGARILHCVAGKPETKVLVATTGGFGFVSTIADMVSNRRAGREFMSVREGDAPVAPFVYEEAKGNYVVALSENSRLLAFAASDLGYLSKGRGVTIMGLDKGEKLVAAAITSRRECWALGSGVRGGKDKEIRIAGDAFTRHIGHRALKGRVLSEKIKPTGLRTERKVAEAP